MKSWYVRRLIIGMVRDKCTVYFIFFIVHKFGLFGFYTSVFLESTYFAEIENFLLKVL